MLNEVNHKSEYTKALEHLFFIILEFFGGKTKEGASNSLVNNKNVTECFTHILDKSKELLLDTRDLNQINSNPLSNLTSLAANISNLNNLNNFPNFNNFNPINNLNNINFNNFNSKSNLPMLENGVINDLGDAVPSKLEENLMLPVSPLIYQNSQSFPGVNLDTLSNYNNFNNFSVNNNIGDFFENNEIKISRKNSSSFSVVQKDDEGLDDFNDKRSMSLNRKSSTFVEEQIQPRALKTTLIINNRK